MRSDTLFQLQRSFGARKCCVTLPQYAEGKRKDRVNERDTLTEQKTNCCALNLQAEKVMLQFTSGGARLAASGEADDWREVKIKIG